MNEIIRVFVGHDSKTPLHTKVCRDSILANTSAPVLIEPLELSSLRRASLYRRQGYTNEDGVMVDSQDGRPFSSEFSFSRFLVPALAQWRGWAIFCDSDFMFRDDIGNLWDHRDPKYAVMVAKQSYTSRATVKKGHFPQSNYSRKNWSSLMLWNLEHPANQMLSQHTVCTFPGSWLHGLKWLQDDEIGTLWSGWNWIEGTTRCNANAVHFTMGTPDIEEYRHAAYADEWLRYALQYK